MVIDGRHEPQERLLDRMIKDIEKTVNKRGVALQLILQAKIDQDVRERHCGLRWMREKSRKCRAAESPVALQWSRRMAKRSVAEASGSEGRQTSRMREPQVETEALLLDIEDTVNKTIHQAPISSSSTDVAMPSATAVGLVCEIKWAMEKLRFPSFARDAFATRKADVSSEERPGFVLDLRAGWDVTEGYHVQELKELGRQCRSLGRMSQLYRPGADENMYYLHEWSPSTSRKLELESCQAAISTYSQT